MIDLKIEERLFESQVISFKVRSDDAKSEDLIEDAPLEYGGDEYFITLVTDVLDEQGVQLKSIEAEISWMKLADLIKPGTTTITSSSPEEGLTQILSQTGWNVGYAVNTGNFTYEADDTTVLNLLWAWCRVTGLEPIFNTLTRTVMLDATSGANKGLSFRYGRNIKSITRTAIPPSVTRIHALGKDDLTVASLNGGTPYLEDYSWYTGQGLTTEEAKAQYRKDELWIDDTIVDAQVLMDMAQAKLNISSRPVITYKAKVVDLSSITSLPEHDFRTGDFVTVYDEIEQGVLDARVSRKVSYPQSPEKNEVELAFNDVLVPEVNTSSSRGSSGKTWELFTSRNTGVKHVRLGHTILNRIRLTTTDEAEWVVGYSFKGVAVGDHTLTLEFTNDELDEAFWVTQEIALVDGQVYDYAFTFGDENLPAGDTVFAVRAWTNNSNGVNLEIGSTALWVLARGTTRQNVVLETSVTYLYTGAKKEFEVPDDVYEILVEAVGGAGGSGNGTPGAGGGGCLIRAGMAVTPGEILDIYVNGDNTSGYGLGGVGDSTSVGNRGGSGGGASSVVPSGGAFSTAHIVAAGGGGGQFCYVGGDASNGGVGGFYEGGTPEITGSSDLRNGNGATQYAGGIAGPGGVDGSFGAGGAAGDTTSNFAGPGAGGGGGWYGGGGGGVAAANGGSMEGGSGGGGSSYTAPWIYDVEAIDGSGGTAHITISWENPEGE